MTTPHLEDYYDIWAEMLEEAEQPDKGWPWEYKLRQAQQEVRFEAGLETRAYAQAKYDSALEGVRKKMRRKMRLQSLLFSELYRWM